MTDTSGREVEGEIVELSSSLVVQVPASGRRELLESDVRTVRLREYTVAKTALKGGFIGAGVGLVVGVIFAQCNASHCADALSGSEVLGLTTFSAGIGAGIGAGISAMSPRYRMVYEKPATAAVTVLPLVTGRQKGVLVSVRF